MRLGSILLAALAATSPAFAGDLDITEITVDQISTGLKAGEFTAVELVQAYLDRIETYEPVYNAYVAMNAAALADAAAIDARIAAGEEVGPLAGVPVAIKEAMDVAGFPSTMGWAPLASAAGGTDLVASQDATLVKRLRDAGAIILGKTNIPEFSTAYNAEDSWAGPTYSAFGPEASPGGSSTGSATAVAGNLAVLATGEDTAGSIQAPAGVQGIVGVKPTFGLIPLTGLAPLGAQLRDVAGPMARTVRDAAIMLDVMAGYSPEDPKTIAAIGHMPEGGYAASLSEGSLKGARIGLYGPGFEATDLSPETAELYAKAVAELEAQGAIVVTDPFAGTDFASLAIDNFGLGTESWGYDLGFWLARLGGDAPHSVAELSELVGQNPIEAAKIAALGLSDEMRATPETLPDLSKAVDARAHYLRIWSAVMAEHQLDAVVVPQDHGGVPTRVDGVHSVVATPEINIAGTPGVIVPAGEYGNGMPFSLVFLGPQWSEAKLLSLAYAYEQATQHRIVPELSEFRSRASSTHLGGPALARRFRPQALGTPPDPARAPGAPAAFAPPPR